MLEELHRPFCRSQAIKAISPDAVMLLAIPPSILVREELGSSVIGHTRGCFNTGLHIVAPQRSEHVANNPVAAAKWLELVGPADHCAIAVGSERPFSAHTVYEPAKHYVREACYFVSEAIARRALGDLLASR